MLKYILGCPCTCSIKLTNRLVQGYTHKIFVLNGVYSTYCKSKLYVGNENYLYKDFILKLMIDPL